MRIGIVAGEASGDILGADLIAALKSRYPDCTFEGIGGKRMLAQGFQSFFPLERLAVMGLVEPLKRLPELLRIRSFLKKHFISNPPDVFIGIDAPDFNLSLEVALKESGIKTVHYVSPSVWAWRQGRVKKIKRGVDLMLTLFPHEEAFYHRHQVPVKCVGHTLADKIPLAPDKRAARDRLSLSDENQKIIALMPGSRSAELKYHWRTFLEAAQSLSLRYKVLFLVAAANPARRKEIDEVLREYESLPIKVFDGQSHDVMLASDVVLMASGTTTLEAMLLKKPMVIVYKMAWLSFAIISRLVKVKHIGLPNLLAGKALVPELIQKAMTKDNIVAELQGFLEGEEALKELKGEFLKIHTQLKLNASESAAQAIQELL